MADRRDIREAFYAELETAAAGQLDASAIGQQFPDSEEDLPRLVHDDTYEHDKMSTEAAPTDVIRDGDDNVTHLVFDIPMLAQFGLVVMDDDEQRKEDTYEQVRRHFERFTTPLVDASDIHADVHTVDVLDTTRRDMTDRAPLARGDQFQVRLGWTRDHEIAVEHIDSIDTSQDIGLDDIEDITYTVT